MFRWFIAEKKFRLRESKIDKQSFCLFEKSRFISRKYSETNLLINVYIYLFIFKFR